jgi:hypothetical protein
MLRNLFGSGSHRLSFEVVLLAIWAGIFSAMLSVGLLAGTPTVRAASTCSAGNAVLGQTPALTGPTPTDWFNVTGEAFAATSRPTMTFSVQVIPWSDPNPMTVAGPVTKFTLPAGQAPDLGFKWTFRAANTGVARITVRISTPRCAAMTVVDFAAPATSTLAAPDDPGHGSARLFILVLGFGLGGLALWRRTRPA